MKTTIVFLIILLARAQSSFAEVEVETGPPFVLLSGQETGGGTNQYWSLCARLVIAGAAAAGGGYAWWNVRQLCRKFFGTNRPPNVPPGTNGSPTNTTSQVAAFYLDDAPPDDSDNDVVEITITINGALETRRISPGLISKEEELENLAAMGLKTLPTRESPAVYAVNGDRVNSNSISFAGGVLKWELPPVTNAPDNRFIFEWSDDLRVWTAFMTNVITAGYPLKAELPGGHGMRFYRVMTAR